MRKMHHSSITVINSLLLLITITTSMKSDLKSTPIFCNQTETWKLGGRDIVADSKGFVLLVALMPMQCEHCHKQLMKFQAVTEKLPEIRIVVVAPYDENPRLIERYREEFPRVAIGMETANERVWNILSGSAHDHFIYDRCGRLISIIRHPRSDTSKFEDTLEALKLAVGYAQCGWCQYDPPDLPAPPRPVISTSGNSARKSKTKTPRIKAIVQPQAFVDYRSSTVSSDRRSSNSSNDKRSYLRTNTVASAHETRSRTSNVYIPSVSTIALSSTAANNNQQQTITTNELQQQQQQQYISQQREEQVAQQGRLKFGTEQQHQRRVVIRPDKDLLKTNNWRASKGWTVSRKFPNRIRQDKSQEFERTQQQDQMRQTQQQQSKERRYQQNQERKKQHEQEKRRQQKQGHELITDQRRVQQEQERIQKQQEKNRRIQEQQRLQEEGRQRKEQERQEQQRLQQLENEKRMEEQQRLQEQQQRTESDLYTDDDDDDDKRESHQPNRKHEEILQPSVMQLHQQRAQQAQDATITRESFSSSKPVVKIPSLYDDEGDYDYSQMISETTTVAPTEKWQTQIPGTEPPGVWPTPFLFEQQVLCNAFTDKVCLQQKKTVGADKMNKCCNKGIYLTDLCMPETCTNVTTDLCCMQKFLQSKYRCCRNDSKAINSPGDAFSRCCYENFVQDDDKCCPAKRAKFHWASAYEVCLPNVRVDLSDLRFSVPLNGKGQGDADAVTINLNEERSWSHTCEQGSNVIQFPYLPEDEESDEGGGENAEEGG